MKKTIYLLAILITSFLIFSCRKDPNEVKAVIALMGDVGADGCGWLVLIDDTFYHPDTLAPEYKKDGLKVKIQYKIKSEKFSCGFTASEKPVIEITSIKKR